jgi:plastocyanin
MRRRWGVVLLAVCGFVFSPFVALARSGSDVAIRDNFYDASVITVQLGDTVSWTNEGSNAHTVTSEGFFDSSPSCLGGVVGCMQPGDRFTLTFDAAGTYRYNCKIHGDAMSGRVVVQATTTSTTTTTTLAGTTSTSSTTTVPDQQASAASQQTPPTIRNGPKVALPKRLDGVQATNKDDDDRRVLVLVDVAIAGATTIAGVVLVRRGRVPFG